MSTVCLLQSSWAKARAAIYQKQGIRKQVNSLNPLMAGCGDG